MDEINECNKKYAEAFARLREKRGMTLQDVAQKSGIPLSTLKRTLQGTTGTPMSTYEMLVTQGLGATMRDFIDEIYAPEPQPDPQTAETAEQTPVPDVTAMRLLLAEKDTRIRQLGKWLRWSVIYSVSITGILVGLFLYDVLNPAVGWFQRQIASLQGDLTGWRL